MCYADNLIFVDNLFFVWQNRLLEFASFFRQTRIFPGKRNVTVQNMALSPFMLMINSIIGNLIGTANSLVCLIPVQRFVISDIF